jgi:2,5-diketo-D-gluconate reductase A
MELGENMSFTPDQNPGIPLNNGQVMPQLGLGVYKVQQDIAVDLVRTALDAGYRRIDTAALYDNEAEVGAGIRRSGYNREDIFVTTKIWNDRQGYDNAIEAIDESLQRLNIDYVDMLLIHWPCPQKDLFVETWQAFQDAQANGKIRGIGVSNFKPAHLDKLLAAGGTVPAINQVEMHPWLQQAELRAYDEAKGIKTEAWSPLARGRFESDALSAIAAKHGKSVAQVVIRWHIEVGNLVIPKSSNPDRLAENIDVFDFALDAGDMQAMTALDGGGRVGPDPDDLN